MRVCVQRVLNASVSSEGEELGSIGRGLLVLVGAAKGDEPQQADYLADKCANLRVFEDENGKMNLSVKDIGGALLAVTNFTLCASCAKGKRPSFDGAARPEEAEPLTERFIASCRAAGVRTETGRFGADMQIGMTADGPVTLIIDK